eukprot:TRINITY_DN6332_c0_g1_i4.p1 TRINITY_DN6332_c0_g1~~TRINITY_DN6332_c0_g1_i4.p1  ORF type:complete len:760 (-),score=202.03 TRINITY_DN6332_c0_g1_i4:784-2982(-)
MHAEVRAFGQFILDQKAANQIQPDLPAYLVPQRPTKFANADEEFQFNRQQLLRSGNLFGLSLVHLLLEYRGIIVIQTATLPTTLTYIVDDPYRYRQDFIIFYNDPLWYDDYDYYRFQRDSDGGPLPGDMIGGPGDQKDDSHGPGDEKNDDSHGAGLSLVHLLLEYRGIIVIQTATLPTTLTYIVDDPYRYRQDFIIFYNDPLWYDDYDYYRFQRDSDGGPLPGDMIGGPGDQKDDSHGPGDEKNDDSHGDNKDDHSDHGDNKDDHSDHGDNKDDHSDHGQDDHDHPDDHDQGDQGNDGQGDQIDDHDNGDDHDKGDQGDDNGGDNGGGDMVDMYGSAGPRNLDDEGKGPEGHDMVLSQDHILPVVVEEVDELELLNRKLQEHHYEFVDNTVEGEEAINAFDMVFYPSKQQVSHDTIPLYVEDLTPNCDLDITLITQCSLDRLLALKRQVKWWKSCLSVAIYVKHDERETWEAEVEEIRQIALQSGCKLTVSIMFESASEHSQAHLYPINALRNLALKGAKSRLVFLLDVDFIGTDGLVQSIQENYNALETLCLDKIALVVPAFELHGDGDVQEVCGWTKDELAEGVRVKNLSGFHMEHFPKGHGPTDFERWFKSRSPYFVDFEEGFEPYTITARSLTPMFDERFRGYGLNKVQHAYQMAFDGYAFQVLSGQFVVSPEHNRSESWKTIYGKEGDFYEQDRLRRLYNTFKEELYQNFSHPAGHDDEEVMPVMSQ